MNNRNPKYDNDNVTLGYLKKILKEETELNNEQIKILPKNYNAPPNPPYYVNSLLVLDGKIYKCIKNRLTGSFSMSDWQLAVNTEDISNSLKAIYDVNKLEYVEQEDGLIESFYCARDPSIDWPTDLDKEKHISDLWHDLSDTFQYVKQTTNPVTYKWVKRSVPSSLFDVIDGYKKIFLKNPSDYKKGDLWFGTETKIAVENSSVFNDEHWQKRDDYVEAFKIEQEQYHTVYILPSITEIDRKMLSEIKKAIDEITLTVSQTYITSTELNTYIDGVKSEASNKYTTKEEYLAQIGITSQQITNIVSQTNNQNEKIAKITQTVDNLNSKISDIADITVSGESTIAKLTLDNVNESEPITIVVRPIGEDISYIYPSETLYPNDNLYLKDRTLRFNNLTTGEIFDYELPIDLLYYDEDTYDEFILSYVSETCYVNKKLKHTGVNGVNELLGTPQTIEFEYPRIHLTDGNYKVELLGYTSGYLQIRLLASNPFTTQFALKVEMNSVINQTKQEIELEVNKKAGAEQTNAQFQIMAENISSRVAKNKVISSINQSPELISILASKIDINGIISLINDGTTTTINGNRITTGSITSNEISAGAIKAENIQAGVITADKIVDKSITSDKVSDSAITNSKIQDGAVGISKVTQDIITVENISAQNISANQIVSGTISAARISSRSIDASKLNITTLSSISSNLGNITGGSIKISKYFSVESDGKTQISTDGGGFFSTRKTTHPYMSAINLANGSTRGIYFLTGTNQENPGSLKSVIYQGPNNAEGTNYELNIYGAEGVEIASNASIYIHSRISLEAIGNSSIWAKGHNLNNARIKTDNGSASSKNVKENIKEFNSTNYTEAYNLLKDIKIYSYDYKYNFYRNKHQYGFIIDEIEKLENYNKFFDFEGDVAKVNKSELDFSNYEDYTKENMPKGCIYVKKYNSDTFDKYLLTICKVMQNKIEKLEELLNGK